MHQPVYESHVKRALIDYFLRVGVRQCLAPTDANIVELNDINALDDLPRQNPWLLETRLVAKPDLLMGKRGKNGFVVLNEEWNNVKQWIREKWDQEISLKGKTSRLNHFLIEPFVAHEQSDEYYFCIKTEAECDVLLLSTKGGVEIESNWDGVKKFDINLEQGLDEGNVRKFIKDNFAGTGFDSETFIEFAVKAYQFFVEWGFVYFEINPLVIKGDDISVLDIKSRLDSAEEWQKGALWEKYFKNHESRIKPSSRAQAEGNQELGKKEDNGTGLLVKEAEQRVAYLDSLTGASLKMKVLNPHGSIWPLVAGGGASVLIADAVVARGKGDELGLYGEYSGNPDQDLVEEYAGQIIGLMLAAYTTLPKTLLIAGGIANFTDVAKTFTGIITALEKHQGGLKKQHVRVLVRRGGPNYQKGLRLMREALDRMGIENEVHGPEIGLTEVVKRI